MDKKTVTSNILSILVGSGVGYAAHGVVDHALNMNSPIVLLVSACLVFGLRDAAIRFLDADAAAKLADDDPRNDTAARAQQAAADTLRNMKPPR